MDRLPETGSSSDGQTEAAIEPIREAAEALATASRALIAARGASGGADRWDATLRLLEEEARDIFTRVTAIGVAVGAYPAERPP